MDNDERLVKLETELEALRDSHKEILLELRAMRNEFSRYKGFFGGIVFIISALATLVEVFWRH